MPSFHLHFSVRESAHGAGQKHWPAACSFPCFNQGTEFSIANCLPQRVDLVVFTIDLPKGLKAPGTRIH
jgi:hypothetical protein